MGTDAPGPEHLPTHRARFGFGDPPSASTDASSPPECIPQERFDAMLHLETEVFFHGVKGCSRGDTQSTRAAHIVRLQPEPRYHAVPAVGPPGVGGRGGTCLEMLGKGLGCLIGRAPPSQGEYRTHRCGMLMLGRGGRNLFRSFPITEVNLSLSCPERAMSNQILILQSQANLTWSLSVNNCHIQFLVGLSGMCVFPPPLPRRLPDDQEMLVAWGGWQEGT